MAMDSSTTSTDLLYVQEPGEGISTMITVASKEDPVLPYSLPYETTRNDRYGDHIVIKGKQKRSQSVTDLGYSFKKASSINRHRRGHESRFLPSCQTNPRRNSLSGAKTYNVVPQLSRRVSDTSVSRSSLHYQLSPSPERSSDRLSNEDENDSGIASGESVLLSSLSTGTDDLEASGCSTEDCGTGVECSGEIKCLSAFEAVDDDFRPCKENAASSLISADTLSRRQQRNHSETEIDTQSVKSAGAVSVRLLPFMQAGNEVVNRELSLTLESKQDFGSQDEVEDDSTTSSWTSPGWRQVVRTRSTCSSEDSADDEMFFSMDESMDSIPETFQTRLGSRTVEDITCKHTNAPSQVVFPNKQSPRAKKTITTNALKLPQKSSSVEEPYTAQDVTVSANRFPGIGFMGSCVKDNGNFGNSVSNILHSARCKSQSNIVQEQSPVNSSFEEQLDESECDFLKPSSKILPQLQRTLRAARQRILLKKTSKIPVWTNNDGSLNQHVDQSLTRVCPSLSSNENAALSSDARLDFEQPALSLKTLQMRNCKETSKKSNLVSTVVTSANRSGHSGLKDAVKDKWKLCSTGEDAGVLVSGLSESPANWKPVSSTVNNAYNSLGRKSVWAKTLEVSLEGKERWRPTDESSRDHSEFVLCLHGSRQRRESTEEEIQEEIPFTPRTDKKVPWKHSRKKTSRVEFILKNELFKKHLSGHIDVVEKNILRNKKFGLKKSFSNLDLTSIDNEKVQAVFDSSLRLHEIDLNDSFTEESETNGFENMTENSITSFNKPSISMGTPEINRLDDLSRSLRRKSLACCDPSLEQLEEICRQVKPFCGASFTPVRRGRLQIPSFDEFRKQRKRESGEERSATHSAVPSQSHSEDMSDGFQGRPHRLLHTISEDDVTETVKSEEFTSVEAQCKNETSEAIDRNDGKKSNMDTVMYGKFNSDRTSSDQGTGDRMDENTSWQRNNRPTSEGKEYNTDNLQNHSANPDLVKESQTTMGCLHVKEQEERLCARNAIQFAQEKVNANVSTEEVTETRSDSENVLPSSRKAEEFKHSISSKNENHNNQSKVDISKIHNSVQTDCASSSQSNLIEKQKHSNSCDDSPRNGEHNIGLPTEMDHTLCFSEENQEHQIQQPNETKNTIKANIINLSANQKESHTEKRRRANCSTTEQCANHNLPASPEADSQNPWTLQTDTVYSPRMEQGKMVNLGSELFEQINRDDDTSSDEEVLCDDVADDGDYDDDDRKCSTNRGTGVLNRLFDDAALSLDTKSWARLFIKVPVLRSSSDVTSQPANDDQCGQRKRRLRKERPYKSDPLSDGGDALTSRKSYSYNSNSRDYCQDEDEGLLLGKAGMKRDSQTSSFPSLEELTEECSSQDSDSDKAGDRQCDRNKKRLSNISMASEDSGVVGQDTCAPDTCGAPYTWPVSPRQETTGTSYLQNMNCQQCNPNPENGQDSMDTQQGTQQVTFCDKCRHRQQERRETIYEIIETEINYGRDLRILKEEFYQPMQTTGLLSTEQLDSVFTNLDDLIAINNQLTEKLRSALHNAAQANDQELALVNIGSLFIESSAMFLAFENYCLNQTQASASLEQLEKERELLRIFLQVSQAENGLLRRMHLKSFLMVPVQRIMKYPLLLNRLYKATPSKHRDKENIMKAREKVEDILVYINAKAKGSGSVRGKRKQSEVGRYSLTEKIEINRVALDVLGWNQTDVIDLITSRMSYAQPSDHTWATKRCRNIKFTPVHAVLFTCRQHNQNENNGSHNDNNNVAIGQQAAVVLVREKGGKYQSVRDPFSLEKCVVTVDPDCDDVFELQEWGREAFIFKAEDQKETKLWVQHLRQQTRNLGQWRRRRNALPNIMLKNV